MKDFSTKIGELEIDNVRFMSWNSYGGHESSSDLAFTADIAYRDKTGSVLITSDDIFIHIEMDNPEFDPSVRSDAYMDMRTKRWIIDMATCEEVLKVILSDDGRAWMAQVNEFINSIPWDDINYDHDMMSDVDYNERHKINLRNIEHLHFYIDDAHQPEESRA